MRERVRSLSRRRRVAVLTLVAVGVGGGGAWPALAGAETCPNAAFRSGPSEHLPDCRAYEQVSPVDKHGYNAFVPGEGEVALAQASGEGPEGSSIGYESRGSLVGSPGPSQAFNPFVGSRTPGGWQTTALAPPTPQAYPAAVFEDVSYHFSADLSQLLVRMPVQRLTETAPQGVYNLYIRHPDGSYSVATAAAPKKPIPAGCVRCYETQDVSDFAGASSDFSHVLFEANESLTAGAPEAPVENLYESVAEHVRLVGILPDNTPAQPAEGASFAATAGAGSPIAPLSSFVKNVNHAISSDGSHILFEAASDEGKGQPREKGQKGLIELYDRVNGVETKEVSGLAPGAKPKDPAAGSAQFWNASSDGSLAFFTSKAELTTQSRTGKKAATETENPGNDLYRYSATTGATTDLSIDPNIVKDKTGANVLGVVGASTDGSYVYFVATGELVPGKGVDGQANLYVFHERVGAPSLSFIATLKPLTPAEEQLEQEGAEFANLSDRAVWTSNPTKLQAYVTPNGEHLAFVSHNALTGYDNTNQRTGEAATEVFEYSVAKTETGRPPTPAQLSCASCNPGARPVGDAFIDGARLYSNTSVATPFYQPRALSDDGSRLFFSSTDTLAGSATQSRQVFEYEGGAAHLISSGSNALEDVFLDASPTGNDVFFVTFDQLAPSDQDGLADVYDARVGGGFPLSVVPAAPCVGSSCQPAPSGAPALPTPISPLLAGSGNLPVPPPTAPVTKLTTKQLLARALAKCKKIRNRRKRHRCVVSAKKHYPPSRAAAVDHHRSR